MPTGSTVFLVFTGVVTFAVVLQTIVLVVFAVAAKAAQAKIMEQADRLQAEVHTIVESSANIMETLDDLTPRMRAITENVQKATDTLRNQVNHIDGVVTDVTGKTRFQVSRIDGMVTDTLDGIARGTRTIQDNIMAPLRQIGGWMNTIRATLDLLRGGGGGDRRSERRTRRYDEDY
jgi:ABC-type transporter Mla subunit MlaD